MNPASGGTVVPWSAQLPGRSKVPGLVPAPGFVWILHVCPVPAWAFSTFLPPSKDMPAGLMGGWRCEWPGIAPALQLLKK